MRRVNPGWRRWLLIAVVVLLACGLLLSGPAHLALHDLGHDHGHDSDSSQAGECQKCWLASPQAPSADGACTRIHATFLRSEEEASEVWKSRREFAASARGPPAA
ncbi:MAG: hypothetical protein FJ299_07580 [Planctomycetes bacterium]|nr:hypothetical protein [Planctomycetota bacterium]